MSLLPPPPPYYYYYYYYDPPMISLRWSDDRGASWSQPLTQPLGQAGQTEINLQWRRLGMARDRVFELSWSSPVKTALNGAFIDVTPCGS